MSPPERVRLLLVEDAPADAEIVMRELKRAGLAVEHRLVDSEEGLRRELTQYAPQVILSDFSMPHFDGMAALALARELAPDVPFIFVSGTIGEEYAIRALKNGATDYVLKTNLMRLPAAVERALESTVIERSRRMTEKKLAKARQRLASVLASLPDVVWSVELPSRNILYVSSAVAQVYGCTAEEAQANPAFWVEAIHPDDRKRVPSDWPGSLDQKFHETEYRIVRPDGSVRWINVRWRVFADPAGVPERVDGLVRDITDAVQQLERLARLAHIRDFTSAVNVAMVRLRDRRQLFEAFCRIALERGGFKVVRLVEFEPKGGALQIAVAGDEEDRVAFNTAVDAYNRDPAGAKSLLAQTLRSAKPVVSNDAAADRRAQLHAFYARTGVGSVAYFPIFTGETVAGAIGLGVPERNYFDADEVELLSELTGNLSFALEMVAKQEKVDYLALYDPLTGLPNRTLFVNRLTQALEATRRQGDRLALVVFDVERFMAINDTYGREVGDKVLKEVAQRLRQVATGENHVAHLGVDQFAFMVPAVRDATDVAGILGDTALRFIEAPITAGGNDVRIATRAGVAVFPEDGADPDALLRNAEASLKQAKESRERYVFYAPQINARVAEQVDLENRLRKAVDNGELFLHYQPKIELASRRIVGLEALMRWNDADGKPLSPAKFVPVLEQTGLILEAGRQALALANAVYLDWRARGLDAPRIAVNVSALQLRERGFVDDVFSAIGWRAQSDCGIDLEITESLLMTDIDESIRKLRALREAGMRIALDDFGTGHSSLAYLSKLPVDTLKIDRAFVQGMTTNADDTSIVSAIISLAQALRLNVVAEGVETEEQARLLQLLRCDQMQGYLFSRPLPPQECERLLVPAPIDGVGRG